MTPSKNLYQFVSHHLDIFIFVFALIVVCTTIFGPIAYQQSLTPAGTIFPFAGGYFPDFYQYLSWIKDGYDGHVLLTSRYTEIINPRVLIHPLFPVIGMIGLLIHVPPFMAYLIARLLATGLFFVGYLLSIHHIFPSKSIRSVALVCLLSATGFWTLVTTPTGTLLQEQIPWSTNFNALYKFNLPPHHFLSLAVSLCIISLLDARIQVKKGKFFFTLIALNVIMGLLNPSQLTLALAIYLGAFGLSFLPLFKRMIYIRLPLGVLIASALPVILYHYQLFQYVQPWSIMYQRMKLFNPPTTLTQYLFALGPLVWISLFAMNKSTLQRPSVILIALWAYIPLVLYLLRGYIPINTSRIFQSYQYIPLSILGAIGIDHIQTSLRRLPKLRLLVPLIATIMLLVYAIIPYQKTYTNYATSLSPSWFNVYVPKSLIQVFTFLDTQTPKESVVLGGEFVSNMIPAFAHNRTLLSREDTAWNYSEKQKEVMELLTGMLSFTQARDVINRYNISYVLYGIDAPSFDQIPPTYHAFLHVVYTNGPITLVRIVAP